MQNIYVLNGSIIFWPEKNLLTGMNDESKRVQLTGPAARCLELLIARKCLVLQNDFYEYAWQGSGFTPSPNTLYQSISVIRRGFREICDNGTDYILTETRKGFRINPAISVLTKMQDFTDLECDKSSCETTVDETTNDLSPHMKLKSYHLKLIIFMFIAAVIAGVFTFRYYKSKTEGKYLFKDYAGPVFISGSQCRFFLSSRNDKEQLSHLNLSFLKCYYQPYVYITIHSYAPNISIISCDRAINMGPTKCDLMDLRDKNEFK